MVDIFEVITITDKEESDKTGISLGITIKIAGHETLCPITKTCNSYEALEMEVKRIQENLESILHTTKGIFGASTNGEMFEFRSDMEPQEIWEILSNITDENLFISSFNNLEEAKRNEVAEYVLTQCNIFSGKASVFSSRYDNETGLME
jgi:hypothetical protein